MTGEHPPASSSTGSGRERARERGAAGASGHGHSQRLTGVPSPDSYPKVRASPRLILDLKTCAAFLLTNLTADNGDV